MCDTGDIVDIGAGIATGGASYVYKKATGSDVPGAALIKKIAGAGPDAAAPPELPPPPPSPDLSDELVQRAATVRRLRMLMSQGIGSSFLTGSGGLTGPAPTSRPGLGGF